jgi:hypothetical protein
VRVLSVLALLAGGIQAVAADERVVPDVRIRHLPVGAEPVRLPFPATHLGARWIGSEEATVEVRAWRPGDGWGRWEPLAVAHDLEDPEQGLVYSGLIRIDGARRLQARTWPGVRTPELVLIDAGRGGPATAVSADAPPGAPPVVTRAGWGADESLRKGRPEHAPVTKLVVHHTVTPNDDPDPAQTVRAIYAFHTRSRGWDDIGYNFLVDGAGRVYEGRFARGYAPGETPTGEDQTGRGVIGAHAKGFNQGSMGFSLLGDFSRDQGPTPAQLDGLVQALAWKAAARGINPHGSDPYTGANGATRRFPNIAGHRDVGETACPGDRLYERLPEVRQRVADAVAGRPAPQPQVPPPAPIPEGPPVPDIPGWWAAHGDGRVLAFGDAPPAGDLGGKHLAAPIVAMAATRGRDGYWLAGADGGFFAFGNAAFAGSAAGRLASLTVHLEPTPTGQGYWVVSRTGEVMAFGDARYFGSLGVAGPAALPQAAEIVGMASTPSGAGYWLAATDGRVFGFGDAVVASAAAAQSVTQIEGHAPGGRVVAIEASPTGTGFWVLGVDGGVFSFGPGFHGSVPGRNVRTNAVELRVSEGGAGYYIAGADGALFAFGDADTRRERPGRPEDAGVVDIALRPGP